MEYPLQNIVWESITMGCGLFFPAVNEWCLTFVRVKAFVITKEALPLPLQCFFSFDRLLLEISAVVSYLSILLNE